MRLNPTPIGVVPVDDDADIATEELIESLIRQIERIVNPLAVVWDSSAQALDRSDAMHCFVTDTVPLRVFKERYKDAGQSSFPTDQDQSASNRPKLLLRYGRKPLLQQTT